MLATINGVQLAYSDLGEGSPPVVLVHGFPLNRSMWDLQLGVVRERHRVIAPDLRGFGASEAGPPGPLTMEQHADDVAALLDHLGIREPVVYCGLSMGGYVGFAFWRRHPERVRALVFADTRAAADTPEGRQARLDMAIRAEALNSPNPAIEGMLAKMFAPTVRLESALAQRVESMMAGTSPRAVADGQRGMAERRDNTDLLSTIGVQTMLLVGEEDVLTPPAESERMAADIPYARLEKIPLAGHMSNMENPDAFNQALARFLGEVSQA